MAKRMSRQERTSAHREAVEAEKRGIRRAIKTDGHLYAAEWYREHRRNGDAVTAEAMEEVWDELVRHDREHPAPPNYGLDEGGLKRTRDRESRRREARDNELVAGIAEEARRKAAGIGGGIYATTHRPEPLDEPEDDGPSPEAEEHEGLRRALGGLGILSRTPLAQGSGRKSKKRKRYTPPPFSS